MTNLHTPPVDRPTDKAALRRHYESLRASVAPGDRAAWETAILQRLLALPAFRDAPLVTGYVATRGEIDLTPLWHATVEAGKTYALPVSLTGAHDGVLSFCATPGFVPKALIRGRFGIAEPPADFPVLDPRDLSGAVLVVPGLCFDDEGYRLGYGGGYYDRYLTTLRSLGVAVTTVGLAFSVCHVPLLPHEPHDRAVDLILDERSVTVAHASL